MMINFLVMGFERWDIGGLQGGLEGTVKMSGLKLSYLCIFGWKVCLLSVSVILFGQLQSFKGNTHGRMKCLQSSRFTKSTLLIYGMASMAAKLLPNPAGWFRGPVMLVMWTRIYMILCYKCFVDKWKTYPTTHTLSSTAPFSRFCRILNIICILFPEKSDFFF